VHLSASLTQDVNSPVPAVCGFQDHLRALTRLRYLGRQSERVVIDTHAAESLTVSGHPHDHRPAPMQIDTPPGVRRPLQTCGASFVGRCEHPAHPAGGHQERGPAPSCHQSALLPDYGLAYGPTPQIPFEIEIGDRHGSTSPRRIGVEMVQALRAEGFTVGYNETFAARRSCAGCTTSVGPHRCGATRDTPGSLPAR
jgi:hypothetical protein